MSKPDEFFHEKERWSMHHLLILSDRAEISKDLPFHRATLLIEIQTFENCCHSNTAASDKGPNQSRRSKSSSEIFPKLAHYLEGNTGEGAVNWNTEQLA